MKLLLAILLISFSIGASADELVNGYIRDDGTYVAPYMRTEPNSTTSDNYSTQGNYNPYTGQPGYTPPPTGFRDPNGTPYRYKRY